MKSKLKDSLDHLKNRKLPACLGLLLMIIGGWLLIRASISFHPNFGPDSFLPAQSPYFFRLYTENSSSLMRFLAGGFLLVSGFSLLFFTNPEEQSRLSWIILNALFISILFWFLTDHALYILNAVNPDEWLIGDWLINYQGGFVRRGLFGEILLTISNFSGIPYVPIVVTTQWGLYLVLLLNTFRLVVKAPVSPLTAMLVYSPAFMLFPVLDPQGAYRKEILLLALLSIICAHFSGSVKVSRQWILPVGVGLASVFLVLNHEMLAPYLLYLVGAVIIGEKGFSKTARNTLIAIIPSTVITALLVFFGRGNNESVIAICNSLQAGSPLYCRSHGAIASIGETIATAHQFVLLHTSGETGLVYVISALLGIIPLTLIVLRRQVRVWLGQTRVFAWLILLFSISILSSLPLLWVAADYGRLIYIHITCQSLLVLLLLSKIPRESFHLYLFPLLMWGVFFLFINAWRLVHYDASVEKAFPILPWLLAIIK